VLVKDTLYVLGGAIAAETPGDPNVSADSIERAQVHPDGTLGPFNTLDSVKLARKRRDHAAVVLGDNLYVLGGRTDTQPEQSIEVARIAPDGSLGSFAIVDRSLTSARSGHASVVIGNTLHVVGGMLSVEHAEIVDGSLQQFGPSEDSTAINRGVAATAVFGDALCVLGGYDGSSTLADVVCASITEDGSLGEFTHTYTLAMPRARTASVMVGPWLYLFGGACIINGVPRVFYSDVVRITRDDAGVFQELHEPSPITERFGSVAVVVGSSVCVIGGYNRDGSGVFLDMVECAAFAP
jgi:N-acetylneuraminic acid mutarotase